MNLPRHSRSHPRRRPRRRSSDPSRHPYLVVVVASVGLVALLGAPPPSPGPGSPAAHRSHRGSTDATTTATLTRRSSVRASLARWQLPEALSRAGAAPLPGGRILLIGGLLASGSSSADVAVLNPATGKLGSVSTLVSPTHDAGTSVLGGKAFLFGGGESSPSTTVEAVTLAAAGRAAGRAGPTGTAGSTTASDPTDPVSVAGQLPQARADDEAVTVGKNAYVVGGYDGASGDAAVLATQDGTSFSTVVMLPVGVRYPAVAAAGGMIYVFGGESASGGTTSEYSTPAGSTTPPPGQEVAVVQEIDPQTGTARVVGELPHALQGAAAFELGGRIYLAGGDSSEQGTAPDSGSRIWSFDPTTDSFHTVGHLAAPVAYAAVAVVEHTAWLVGGEQDGVAVATAQKVVLRPLRRGSSTRSPHGDRRRRHS